MSTSDEIPAAVAAADEAYEAMKTVAETTGSGLSAGPEVYSVLGNLKLLAGPILTEALTNLGQGLSRSLEDPTYDVYQDDASDPGIAAMNTMDYLNQAATKAAELAALLEAAQSAITRQGYNRPGPQHGDTVALERPDGTHVRGTWHHSPGTDPYLVDDHGDKHTDYTTTSGAGRRNIISAS